MNIEEQQPLRVNFKGMTDKMLNMFQYFFRDPCNNYCEIVDDETAELTIIDLDGVEGRQLVDEHLERHPENPLIVLSFHDKEVDHAILVHKPVKPELLMLALEAANAKIQSRKLAENPPAKKQLTEKDIAGSGEHKAQVVSGSDVKSESEYVSGAPVDIVLEPTGEILAVKASVPERGKAKSEDELEDEAGSNDSSKLSTGKIEKVAGKAAATEEVIPEQDVSKEKAKTKTPKLLKVVDDKKTPATDKDSLSVIDKAVSLTNTRDERGYIGSAPDIDHEDADQLLSAQYDPNNYFQCHIQQAALKATKFDKAVLLAMPHGSLVVCSDAKSVLLNIKESRLRAFCALPITDETLTIIFMENSALQEYRDNAESITLEQLLWKAAIWASRGRIPQGTNLINLVYFQHWPNISRSLLFPNALRIAALWAEQPCSLIETAKILKIPQRYVFAFYSASNSIGIAFVRNGSGNGNGQPIKIRKARESNLLGRIMDHLHGAKRKINGDNE